MADNVQLEKDFKREVLIHKPEIAMSNDLWSSIAVGWVLGKGLTLDEAYSFKKYFIIRLSSFNDYNEEQLAQKVPVQKLTKDILNTVKQYTPPDNTEARLLSTIYYQIQKIRISIGNQVEKVIANNKANKTKTPVSFEALEFLSDQFHIIEKEAEKIMTLFYAKNDMKWFFEQTMGVGPVLATALLSQIDISKTPYAGNLWSYAGFINDVWEKGKKRPWNADLKVACWKIGQSFIKTSEKPDSTYGKLWKTRKQEYWQRNLNGDYVETCKNVLATKNMGKNTMAIQWYQGDCDPHLVLAELNRVDTIKQQVRALKDQLRANKIVISKYQELHPELFPVAMIDIKNCLATNPANGVPMLPPAHIDAMASRYAVKIFLAHLQKCWWEFTYTSPAPTPWVINKYPEQHHKNIDPEQVIPTNHPAYAKRTAPPTSFPGRTIPRPLKVNARALSTPPTSAIEQVIADNIKGK
jgi:hypothetical protein